jgi:hypothetical protein
MAGVSKFPQLSVAKATHGTPTALKGGPRWGKPYQGSWQGNKAKEDFCAQRRGVIDRLVEPANVLCSADYDQYKVVFMEQQAHGLEVWMQPLVQLRAPKIFNLRSDPFERAEHEAGGLTNGSSTHLCSFRLRRSSASS